MAEISIFEDEAFSVEALLAVINTDHPVPGQLAALGLFEEQGVSSLVVQIEKDGTTLQLVEAKARGGVGQVVTGDKRQLVPFNTVHLPQTFQILADEIQGIRAVGSRTELQSAEAVVAKRLEKARRQLDLTHEYQRIGAIKGKILDADGSTVLLDIYQAFGLRKPKPRSLELGNPEGDLSGILADLLDEQDDALGNVTSTGSRAFCGKNFWAKLIDHPKVRGTYLNTLQAAQLRGDRRQSFEFGGVVWE
ncbi:major capsid protein, partial [Pseudomonas aeruginosa]